MRVIEVLTSEKQYFTIQHNVPCSLVQACDQVMNLDSSRLKVILQ